MKPLFTIILAGHQVAPYLAKALDSIANQTFHDFEALLYVEESADNSLAICQEWARRDSRFKIATGPKSGAVATTRNYGIDHATGEYLVVLDGDDWIVPDMLEKLAQKLEKTGQVDVLSFAEVMTAQEDADIGKCSKNSNFGLQDDLDGVFSGMEAIRRVGKKHGQFICCTVFSIYRVEFMKCNHLYQTDGLLAEDFESTPRIWFAARTFAYLDKVCYVYRRRPNSITTTASSRLILDFARQLNSLMEFAEANVIPDDILTIWSNQWISMLYWRLYHPITSLHNTNEDRRQVFAILFAGSGKQRLQRFVARTTFPKRLAWPLILLAAKGCHFPAKLFFRKIYYPLIQRRDQAHTQHNP